MYCRVLFLAGIASSASPAGERILDARLHHLRSGETREWTDFPAAAEGRDFRLSFNVQANATQQTLRLRHVDVKERWDVRLNDKPLIQLSRDENDIVTLLPLAAGALARGKTSWSSPRAERTPMTSTLEISGCLRGLSTR